jgi:hypothetical protein
MFENKFFFTAETPRTQSEPFFFLAVERTAMKNRLSLRHPNYPEGSVAYRLPASYPGLRIGALVLDRRSLPWQSITSLLSALWYARTSLADLYD